MIFPLKYTNNTLNKIILLLIQVFIVSIRKKNFVFL